MKNVLWLRDEAGKFEIYGSQNNTVAIIEKFPFVASMDVVHSGRSRSSGSIDVPFPNKSACTGETKGSEEELPQKERTHQAWWQYSKLSSRDGFRKWVDMDVAISETLEEAWSKKNTTQEDRVGVGEVEATEVVEGGSALLYENVRYQYTGKTGKTNDYIANLTEMTQVNVNNGNVRIIRRM